MALDINELMTAAIAFQSQLLPERQPLTAAEPVRQHTMSLPVAGSPSNAAACLSPTSVTPAGVERSLFELEEIKANLAIARFRASAASLRRGTPVTSSWCKANPDIGKADEAHILQLEYCLQAKVAERDELLRQRGAAEPSRPSHGKWPSRALQELQSLLSCPGQAGATLPATALENQPVTSSEHLVDYLCMKLKDCQDTKRRFFERYLEVRDVLLASRSSSPAVPLPMPLNALPPRNPRPLQRYPASPRKHAASASPRGGRCRNHSTAVVPGNRSGSPVLPPRNPLQEGQEVLRKEREWFASDQAAFQASQCAAEQMHQKVFAAVLGLERKVSALKKELDETRALDQLRANQLQLVVSEALKRTDMPPT
eukprot:TRINITY_DN39357_c0_g1_i1.p1 TRINITY_DN39357_c0_g1~~TRINITY_DN39357_c0_g1_i1.p1  ORF type:complete len:392 (+),score=58.83 TRINITY_DN39357_c0_g1_i1:68-1177(+)